MCCCSQELVGAAKVVSDKSAADKIVAKAANVGAAGAWQQLPRWFQTNLLQKLPQLLQMEIGE